ncbi:hypothetical protein EC973_001199 [Apophysomyces ossiformis]|uniref:Uncharacterized protein n=1 Tax=Apophysomyces ossiformis TaxID=679940 RepID=A0A8H7ENP9_9FUNG|nr:hypothetical protein EC973_001199 [Apophysomyces ossiformis]
MRFKRRNIKSTAAFTKAVREALDSSGKDRSKQYEALQLVFQRYGFYYPSTIVFGGKLILNGKDRPELWEGNEGTTKKESTKWGEYISKERQRFIIEVLEQDLQHVVAVGGDEGKLQSGVTEWISTLETGLGIVLRASFRPTYDLLDKSLIHRVLDVYELSERDDWDHCIQGVHADLNPGQKQAIEIANSAGICFYPKDNLKVAKENFNWKENVAAWTDAKFFREHSIDQQLVDTDWVNYTHLPGTQGYSFFACNALRHSSGTETREIRELYIPRRHVGYHYEISLLSDTIKPTKEFENAITHALLAHGDDARFAELQEVFRIYGYYWPHMIITGGKISYTADSILYGSPSKIIEKVVKKGLLQDIFGGKPSLLLVRRPDIDGWLASTINGQVPIIIADVRPLYELLQPEISSEIRRLYTVAYNQCKASIPCTIVKDADTENALIALSNTQVKACVTKGIYYDGSLAAEDAVEIIKDSEINTLTVSLKYQGKPQVEWMTRKTGLSASIHADAFLPDHFLNEVEPLCGFTQTAIEEYIEASGLRGQQTIREETYFAMYVVYRELALPSGHIKATDNLSVAVAKALAMEDELERYHELRKVFRRFGYYYPTSILLGGRITLDHVPPKFSSIMSETDAIEEISRLLSSRRENFDVIGGDTIVGNYQNWIDSIEDDQARIQFKSMRPLYEILEADQRGQVQRLFDKYAYRYDEVPKLPKALHLDGVEAEDEAFEFAQNTILSRMIMLRDLSKHPDIDYITRHEIGSKELEKQSLLDLDSELPKDIYFNMGAQGAYKERDTSSDRQGVNVARSYELVYVVYKELCLPDDFVQPTVEFKEAICRALRVGNLDYDTYYALQDVFQRFGGRLILQRPANDQADQQIASVSNVKKRYQDYLTMCRLGEIDGTLPANETNQMPARSDDSAWITEYGQRSSWQVTTTIIENSIARSKNMKALGGDSVCLLWNDLKSWISSVELNQQLIRCSGIRPLYQLLDSDERQKIQQIYKNLASSDDRIRYNNPLKLTSYNDAVNKERDIVGDDEDVSTEPLYERLRKASFHNMRSAIEFIHSACADSGFPITEEQTADNIVTVRCSYSHQPNNTLSSSRNEQSANDLCPWKVLLLRNEDATWKLEKIGNINQCIHNHELNQDAESYYQLASRESRTISFENNDRSTISPIKAPNEQQTIILSIESVKRQNTRSLAVAQYIRYSDMLHLRLLDSKTAARLSILNDTSLKNLINIAKLKHVERLLRKLLETYVSASQCLKTLGYREELIDSIKDSELDYIWKLVPYPLNNSYERAICSFDYIRNNDIVLFESQAVFDGSKKLYLSVTSDGLSCTISESPGELQCRQAGWQVIRNIHNAINPRRTWIKLSAELQIELLSASFQKGDDDKDVLYQTMDPYIRLLQRDEDEDDEDRYNEKEMEQAKQNDEKKEGKRASLPKQGVDNEHQAIYMDAMRQSRIESLRLQGQKGKREAYYTLAKLLWSMEQYQESLAMYEEAAKLSMPEAYCELGSIYHSGFSSDHYVIEPNLDTALFYYSIGGILGSYAAAVKAAKGFKNERNGSPRIDYDKARQWYVLANTRFPGYSVNGSFKPSPAVLETARIDHALAKTTSNSMEAEEYHRNAFGAFQALAESKPYAKYMVAMYHLYGWGIQKPDPNLGFSMLVSLVESGLREVPLAIAKCYEEGIGVEHDSVKAAAYRELVNSMPK